VARPPPLALSFPSSAPELGRPLPTSCAFWRRIRVLSKEFCIIKNVPGRYGCGGAICPLYWRLCLIGPAPLPFGHLRLLFQVEQVLETTPLYPF